MFNYSRLYWTIKICFAARAIPHKFWKTSNFYRTLCEALLLLTKMLQPSPSIERCGQSIVVLTLYGDSCASSMNIMYDLEQVNKMSAKQNAFQFRGEFNELLLCMMRRPNLIKFFPTPWRHCNLSKLTIVHLMLIKDKYLGQKLLER